MINQSNQQDRRSQNTRRHSRVVCFHSQFSSKFLLKRLEALWCFAVLNQGTFIAPFFIVFFQFICTFPTVVLRDVIHLLSNFGVTFPWVNATHLRCEMKRHFAVNINKYGLCLTVWRSVMKPFYFTTNINSVKPRGRSSRPKGHRCPQIMQNPIGFDLGTIIRPNCCARRWERKKKGGVIDWILCRCCRGS